MAFINLEKIHFFRQNSIKKLHFVPFLHLYWPQVGRLGKVTSNLLITFGKIFPF